MSKDQITEQNFKPRPIDPEDQSYRDVMLLNPQLPMMPRYRFEDFGAFWSCSCGQINRNGVCANCGLERELLRKLFPAPDDAAGSGAESPFSKEDAGGAAGADAEGASSAEQNTAGAKASGIGAGAAAGLRPGQDPNREEEAPAAAAGDDGPRGRRRSRGQIVAIIIICVLILGTAFAALKFLILPQMYKEDAQRARAVETALMEDMPEVFRPFEDLAYDTYCATGDRMYTDKKYGRASTYYKKASKIRPSDELEQKILDAKFSYVRTHRDREEDREQVADYLDDLVAADYPGAKEMYDGFYVWGASTVANTDKEDLSEDLETVTAGKTIYFHSTLSGGPPEGTVRLSYTITYPDGSVDSGDMSSEKGAGQSVTTGCRYAKAVSGSEQKITYRLYVKRNHELLSTDSVQLKPAPQPRPQVPVHPTAPTLPMGDF